MNVVAAIIAALLAPPDKSGEWQRYFALWPVTVDAYDVSEIKNGRFRYPVWGWVDRRWFVWTDNEIDGSPERHEFWRYRIAK